MISYSCSGYGSEQEYPNAPTGIWSLAIQPLACHFTNWAIKINLIDF